MRKADIQRSYHSSSRHRPMINVKWYPYLPDMIRKFEGVQRRGKFICKTCGSTGRNGRHDYHADHPFKPGGLYHVHEFGDDTKFWAWVHELDDIVDPYSHDDPFQVAEEIAREVGWENAKDSAEFIFGKRASVYSEGRSGGWLVVDGIGDPDDWDLMDLNAWSKFDRDIRAIVEDLDYQFIWHLHVNVWEPLVVEPERRQAERGAEADAEMLDAIVQSAKEAA